MLIEREQATGKVQEVYDDIENHFGMVPNFFKAQAAVDPLWLEVNWQRQKLIMLTETGLDRKTKELIALTVSLVRGCEYCSLAHETMSLMSGATPADVAEEKKIVELFASFTSIADSLQIPCDVRPEQVKQ